MFGMYEPRSNSYDEEGEAAPTPLHWHDILLFPIYFVLTIFGMFIVSLMPEIALLLYFLHDVYSTAKTTFETGKLAYPFLARVGMILGIFLTYKFTTLPPNAHEHSSAFVILAICFVILFTIIPFLAFTLYSLRQICLEIKRGLNGFKPCILLGILLGILAVAILVSQVWHPSAAAPGSLNSSGQVDRVRSINIVVDNFFRKFLGRRVDEFGNPSTQ